MEGAETLSELAVRNIRLRRGLFPQPACFSLDASFSSTETEEREPRSTADSVLRACLWKAPTPLNSALLFSLALCLSDVVLPVSMLWLRCFNGENGCWRTRRSNKQSHFFWKLSEYYENTSEDTQQQIIRETFHLVSKRDENVCNFLEGGLLIGGSDNKLIYRHYATLYFVFCVDSSESELGILDLIQVFVETLDKCFENVCELDLIFHVDK
ncbi:PREDICTED: uncharacterized protein LOC104485132, partial [Chlamydotis macqueenii]|uniref:uncharacterized protein LOC104485132 n=1 Tax=Chlamydotis macqueenii TaxID=187382 RepID=UPI000529AA45